MSPPERPAEVHPIEELLTAMEDYVPTVRLELSSVPTSESVASVPLVQTPQIPDDLTTYYLNKTGFVCPDVRVYVEPDRSYGHAPSVTIVPQRRSMPAGKD